MKNTKNKHVVCLGNYQIPPNERKITKIQKEEKEFGTVHIELLAHPGWARIQVKH